MLIWWTDIGSTKCGSYVWDYFKHVSKPTLKHMGLSLLSNQVSTDERDIFIVCLSAAAHKFLVTILASGEHENQLTDHLQQRVSNYKRAALEALNRIPLVTTPSLSLLQAVLCGVGPHLLRYRHWPSVWLGQIDLHSPRVREREGCLRLDSNCLSYRYWLRVAFKSPSTWQSFHDGGRIFLSAVVLHVG